jgi:catechol 2,3-dioxygenase-like lactoylglutathione lyase family enzyme
MRARFSAIVFAASILATGLPPAAHSQDGARPKITGISHLAVYASDMKATDHYYADLIGAVRGPDPENAKGARYYINATQFVEVLPLPANAGVNRMDHTAYKTESAEALRKYLAAKGWKTPEKVDRFSDGSRAFRVADPEGNVVEFVQPPANPKAIDAATAPGKHIIHVGIMVHSRAAEDKFYEDILGFRPYWFGGMSEARVDWVSQQTPDSHDWLEYMLHAGNIDMSGTGIPAGMSQRDLGVLDHLSIGVTSVPDSFKMLGAGNRLTGRNDGKTQIGKDGKAQFNMYDPDGIRLELMEFHAKEKPCCSPFTAKDPEPDPAE